MIQWTFLRSAGVGGKSCCRAGCGSLHIQLPIFGLSHSLKAVLLRPPPPRMTWSHLFSPRNISFFSRALGGCPAAFSQRILWEWACVSWSFYKKKKKNRLPRMENLTM